jgi:hypothetical protein
MKDFPPLSEFLREAGVTSETPKEEVTALKKKHARDYQVWYHKHQRKQTTHRYTLRFSKTEWYELKRTVDRHAPTDFPAITKQTDLASFIKRAALAHISKQYLPQDPRPMMSLTQELRLVANMLGQVADSIARLRRQNWISGEGGVEAASLFDQYTSLQNLILGIEQSFTTFMHTPPPTLKQALKESLQDRPDKIGQLVEYLLSIKK